eukprot:scaffold262611_cov21-Prasinocladus_malaysianus.AAC.1
MSHAEERVPIFGSVERRVGTLIVNNRMRSTVNVIAQTPTVSRLPGLGGPTAQAPQGTGPQTSNRFPDTLDVPLCKCCCEHFELIRDIPPANPATEC